jgi:hypothetical protein
MLDHPLSICLQGLGAFYRKMLAVSLQDLAFGYR